MWGLAYRLVGKKKLGKLDKEMWIGGAAVDSDPPITSDSDCSSLTPRSQFLDQQPFLRTRLVQRRAVDDPFLLEVTADGIPIEEATTCDLRRGERRGERGGLRGRG